MDESRDFDYTVMRDFMRSCQKPILLLADDLPKHSYAVAMEAALLASQSEISISPWETSKEQIPWAVRQIVSFLRADLSRTMRDPV